MNFHFVSRYRSHITHDGFPVADALLEARLSDVRDEQTHVRVGEDRLLGKPVGDHHVGRDTMCYAV